MSGASDLQRLMALAGMVREARRAALARAMAAREETRARIAALDRPGPADLDPLAEAQAALRYGRWADARRADLNLGLARQTAAWIEARGEAALATARTDVVGALQRDAARERSRTAARRDGEG